MTQVSTQENRSRVIDGVAQSVPLKAGLAEAGLRIVAVSPESASDDGSIDALKLRGVDHDSRRIVPGMGFLALPAVRDDAERSRHGARYAIAALSRGAVAVFCDTADFDWVRELVEESSEAVSAPIIGLPNLTQAVPRIVDVFEGLPAFGRRGSRQSRAGADGAAKATVYTAENDSAASPQGGFGDPDVGVLVAVTGTDGKTTTAHWIAALLDGALGRYRSRAQEVEINRRGVVSGREVTSRRAVSSTWVVGTLGAGPAPAVREAVATQVHTPLTTPDRIELRRLLRRASLADAQAVVMEASSHALDQGRLDGLSLDVAVLTQLGHDHLDYHGSLEAYAAAKARLFRDYTPTGRWVVNLDDSFGRSLWRSALDASVNEAALGNDAVPEAGFRLWGYSVGRRLAQDADEIGVGSVGLGLGPVAGAGVVEVTSVCPTAEGLNLTLRLWRGEAEGWRPLRLGSTVAPPAQGPGAIGLSHDFDVTALAGETTSATPASGHDVGRDAETLSFTLPALGRFQAENVAAALAAVCAVIDGRAYPCAVAADDVLATLFAVSVPVLVDLPAVPGRMERFVVAGVNVVVDYAHTPGALNATLLTLSEHVACDGAEIICVMGCGGDRDVAKRPLMGAVAARLADVVWVTDDNPRSESPAAIRAAILAGAQAEPLRRARMIKECANRRDAIAGAVAMARPGDFVLVAGKGHETGQWIGGERHEHSDRAFVVELASAARFAASNDRATGTRSAYKFEWPKSTLSHRAKTNSDCTVRRVGRLLLEAASRTHALRRSAPVRVIGLQYVGVDGALDACAGEAA
ncbi:MAG: Mur ligase family protein [Thioalkalivibrionaceae bacterium]